MENEILTTGAVLQDGKYRIMSVLGQGGFGITYLAEQVMLKRKVAIKEFYMKEYCGRDGETSAVSVNTAGGREIVSKFREKFLKEAYNLAKLSHPNIVRIIDVFEENSTAYYAMEYADGGSLSDKVKAMGYLPEPLAKRVITEVASALSYIHKRNMTHLDVKPGNIMLGEDDRAVLIDFGLSKQYDHSTGNQTSTTPVGISEGYAPMEQYMQTGVGEFSPETDIYALGATYFKLLTGKTPPCANVINDSGVPLADLRARGVSQAAMSAISKAMEPRKRDRFSDADEFIRAVEGQAPAGGYGSAGGYTGPAAGGYAGSTAGYGGAAGGYVAGADDDSETRMFGAAPGADGGQYGNAGGVYAGGYEQPYTDDSSSKTKKVLLIAIAVGIVAIIGVILAIVGLGGSDHKALPSSYESSETTAVESTTPQSTSGFPATANCTVTGNIAGFGGSYTLVFHDTWGEISPNEPAKAGRLANVTYNSSTGALSASATTPSGQVVGRYDGILTYINGVYTFTGTFYNTRGKGANVQMTGTN